MNDFRGIELKIGDRIAYATASSNNVQIIEAEIVEIIEPTRKQRYLADSAGAALKVKTNQAYRPSGTWREDDRFKIVTLTVPRRVAKLENIDAPLARRQY